MESISIDRPDDMHLHLRDGAMLRAVVGHTAERFGRAIVMPNLSEPVTTTAAAGSYRERILKALPSGAVFDPLMTLYLTSDLDPDEVAKAAEAPFVHGVKLYPAGATTNSEAGVESLDGVMPALEAMARHGLPLLVHGESIDPMVDVFDRERAFIDTSLIPLAARVPELRVVFEHVTTADAVAWVMESPPHVVATLTPQHLLLNRNALFDGGLRPHHYCLPVLKRERHRRALVDAAISGSPKFFLGTDSAPHTAALKEAAVGCAGIYSAHAGLELYAEVFDAEGALDRFEGFASHHGADFYGLPRASERITLQRVPWVVPEHYATSEGDLKPFRAGGTVAWRLGSAAG